MRRIMQTMLALLARAILARYRPDVIGITGSVGKTSTRDAIMAVLSPHFSVGTAEKNNNTEIGVPLAIIQGEQLPGRSPAKWCRVFGCAMRLLAVRNRRYPKILVLEMGLDRPGDIRYLTRLAPSRIGVLTSISPAHLEKFESLEQLAQEKRMILTHLKGGHSFAIVNADDSLASENLYEIHAAHVMRYGTHASADIRATGVRTTSRFQGGTIETWLACDVAMQGMKKRLELDGVVGSHLLHSALCAIAVGSALGLSLDQMIQDIRSFRPHPGRLNPLAGIKRTLVLDDSYNASPASMRAALDALSSFDIDTDARRIAVLGDMLELGSASDDHHREIGAYAAKKDVDLLAVVGRRAHLLADAAHAAGLDEKRIVRCNDTVAAAKFLKKNIHSGDVVLVKASEGMRFETIVKELIAEPERSHELLVRQSPDWLSTPLSSSPA